MPDRGVISKNYHYKGSQGNKFRLRVMGGHHISKLPCIKPHQPEKSASKHVTCWLLCFCAWFHFSQKNLTAVHVRPLRASWLLLMQSMHASFPRWFLSWRSAPIYSAHFSFLLWSTVSSPPSLRRWNYDWWIYILNNYITQRRGLEMNSCWNLV